MTEPLDDNEENHKKKRGEGEGEAGQPVGFVRASGEGVITLSVEEKKRVWTEHRHLKELGEVVAAVAEFFSEFPARASANCVVAWENIKGIAIVNLAIKFGQDVATLVRERSRESGVKIKRDYGIIIKMQKRGGMAVSPVMPQAGLS